MTQTMYPRKGKGMSEAQWQNIGRAIGDGIIDDGGWPYGLTNKNSVDNTVTIGVDTGTGFAAAFLSLLFPGLGHLYAGAPMRALGFAFVASGPLVRSSYHAAEGFVAARLGRPEPKARTLGGAAGAILARARPGRWVRDEDQPGSGDRVHEPIEHHRPCQGGRPLPHPPRRRLDSS